MILFFYGEDTFRMRQKLSELKAKFISASLGDTNLVVLEGAEVSYDEIIRQILAIPFLAKTRLVVIENLLKNGKKEVLEKIPETLKKVPSSTVLVLVEEGLPDRRTSLFKKLSQERAHSTGSTSSQQASSVRAEEFKLLEPESLRRWIKKEVEVRGGTIDSPAIVQLANYLGNDLWRQSNEIDKLLAYEKKISKESIELLVNPQVEADIFGMIEAVARRDLKNAMRELYRLLQTGEHELYLLTMIGYEYRNLLIIKDLEERMKSGNAWALAKRAGLHPFVVQKAWAILPNYKLEDLKVIYGKILDFDVRIKTGKIEPRVGLELLIYQLTTQKSEIRPLREA